MTLPMKRSALLVIDAQESFRQRSIWSEIDPTPYFSRQQALIDGCLERNVPVVRIFHVDPEGTFSLASGFVRPLEELLYTPTVTFQKHYHSALAGTALGAWLLEQGISRLIVSGIRTEQCCETTTRHASDSGFAVDYVSEATLTFPMTHARSGRTYSPQEIREQTELVLEDRFARIVTVEQALAALA